MAADLALQQPRVAQARVLADDRVGDRRQVTALHARPVVLFVDQDDPDVLLEVGLTIDHYGVTFTGIEPGERDQEQHDAVRDAFFVDADDWKGMILGQFRALAIQTINGLATEIAP